MFAFLHFVTAASLGEHRVRELNDEINKLNKTKSYWDARIVELGGGDASKGRKFYDVEGSSIRLYIVHLDSPLAYHVNSRFANVTFGLRLYLMELEAAFLESL